MFTFVYLIGFCILCMIQYSTSEICETCLCLNTTNEEPVIDCSGKQLENNNVLNFELLTLDEYQSLNKLVLSKNDIINLPKHLLKKLRPLKSLDLSENLIENLYTNVFTDLSNLEDLNLSKNKLTVFDDSLLKVIPTLLTLNVSYNQIHTVESVADNKTRKITYLDFSHNNISSLPKKFFELLSNLQYLNLSFNRIDSLDFNLMHLNSLKAFYINNNFLKLLNMQILPKSLIKLHCGHNQIKEIIYESLQLESLNVEYNQISEIHKNLTKLESLQYLNVAGNALSDLLNISVETLKTLDISNNKLVHIPEALSINNFPLLSEFNISKNPIQNLKFNFDLKLHLFIASNMSTLKTIDKDTFANLRAPASGCINLTLSNNEMLSFIHEDAFEHLDLCSLDLSNNRLSYVSPKLVMHNSTFVVHDINLQGNPFKCNCSLQWILNDLVPNLYSMNPNLLDDLRCALPLQISNIRMVHWYGWKEQFFCSEERLNENLVMKTANIVDEKVKFDSSTGLLIVVGAATIVLTVLIIIGFIWTHRVSMIKRRINRKF